MSEYEGTDGYDDDGNCAVEDIVCLLYLQQSQKSPICKSDNTRGNY